MSNSTIILFTLIVVFIIGLVFGFFTGTGAVGKVWRDECNKIGKHVSRDEVYICYKEVKTTKE